MLKYYSFVGVHYMPAMKIGGKYLIFLIFLAQIGLGMWCSVVVLKFLIEMNTLMERLDGLNFFLFQICSLMTFWLMLYDSFQYRNAQFEFWRIFSRINRDFCQQNDMKKWIYLSILFGLLLLDTTYFVLALSHKNTSSTSNKIMQYLFLNFLDHRKLFYLLHLKVIAFQLHKIECDLKQNDKIHLNWLRRYYVLTYEMCDLTNTIFGLSQLSLILLSFHSFITYSNSIYRMMNRQLKMFNYGNCFQHIMFVLQCI